MYDSHIFNKNKLKICSGIISEAFNIKLCNHNGSSNHVNHLFQDTKPTDNASVGTTKHCLKVVRHMVEVR